jgi:YfiR/HmsC-like
MHHRVATLAACALAIGLARPARADASDDRRALVMLRVLAYDNHLRERAGDAVGVVIVYPAGDSGVAERVRWTTAFANASKLKVDGRPVVVAAHKFESTRALDRMLHDLHAVGLVACDGLAKAIAIEDLAALTRANKVLSFSTREREVVKGLAVGIVPGTTRDEIVVNLAAATAEGVKFDAGLLQLARTVAP